MLLVKVNMIGESFPSTPSSLYAPDTEEETDNLASCSCSPNRSALRISYPAFLMIFDCVIQRKKRVSSGSREKADNNSVSDRGDRTLVIFCFSRTFLSGTMAMIFF